MDMEDLSGLEELRSSRTKLAPERHTETQPGPSTWSRVRARELRATFEGILPEPTPAHTGTQPS